MSASKQKNVICDVTAPAGPAYAGPMQRVIRTFLSSLPLVALPAIAADTSVATGITSIGPSMFIFTIAIALLLTLAFRASASRFTRVLATRIGRRRIHSCLAANCLHQAQDFILPGAYGGLARIDHAALYQHGIVCIRAVHFHGKIDGDADDPQWTSSSGFSTKRFLNPLIQNEGRARAIRKVLPGTAVVNLVIFTGKVEFGAPQPSNVIELEQLSRFLHDFSTQSENDPVPDAAWQMLSAAIQHDAAAQKDFAAQISFS
jgi:hypothetical protein